MTSATRRPAVLTDARGDRQRQPGVLRETMREVSRRLWRILIAMAGCTGGLVRSGLTPRWVAAGLGITAAVLMVGWVVVPVAVGAVRHHRKSKELHPTP